VAAAADALLPTEKPWSKMTPAEKAAKKAKDEKEKKEKAEKEARENPTVDENGEHIMTVAEAKAQAAELQNTLVAGEAAVEEKIRLEQERLANEPAVPDEPVK
jgi:DNA-directed RNA polymerase subunit M/transcription elongation factor TFIIS